MSGPFCKDCRFYDEFALDPELSSCTHPVSGGVVSPITGRIGAVRHVWTHCSTQRKENRFWSRMLNTCGAAGRFFEATQEEKT